MSDAHERLMSLLEKYLTADAEHMGEAVQEVKRGRNGEITVVLVDKIRAADLLVKLLDASAWYPAGAVSGSYPCEDAEKLETIHRILTKYDKRQSAKENESESRD